MANPGPLRISSGAQALSGPSCRCPQKTFSFEARARRPLIPGFQASLRPFWVQLQQAPSDCSGPPAGLGFLPACRSNRPFPRACPFEESPPSLHNELICIRLWCRPRRECGQVILLWRARCSVQQSTVFCEVTAHRDSIACPDFESSEMPRPLVGSRHCKN